MAQTIGIVVDVAICLVVAIYAIIGFHKGFIKSIISLFSWVVCIAVAIFTAKYVASWINSIYDVSGLIGNKISEALVNMNNNFATPINEAGSKDVVLSYCDNLNPLLKKLISIVFSNSKIDYVNCTDTVGSVVGYAVGNVCMLIIAGVLVIIVLKIVLALLGKLFDNITRVRILGGLNKVLGLVFGVVKAGLFVVVANCALVALSLIPVVNKTIKPIIQDNTYVEKVIYNETDKLAEKYVINGDLVQNWIQSLWDAR